MTCVNWAQIGDNICKAREAANLDQKTVASYLGMEISFYKSIELGLTDIDTYSLLRLCEILTTTPAILLENATTYLTQTAMIKKQCELMKNIYIVKI